MLATGLKPLPRPLNVSIMPIKIPEIEFNQILSAFSKYITKQFTTNTPIKQLILIVPIFKLNELVISIIIIAAINPRIVPKIALILSFRLAPKNLRFLLF